MYPSLLNSGRIAMLAVLGHVTAASGMRFTGQLSSDLVTAEDYQPQAFRSLVHWIRTPI